MELAHGHIESVNVFWWQTQKAISSMIREVDAIYIAIYIQTKGSKRE
jgi:hypothetical protein